MENRLLSCIDTQVALLKLTLPDVMPETKVCITIPAKNEADFLLGTLTALVNQIDDAGDFIDSSIYEIIVLCHNCTDDTHDIALKFKKDHPALNLHLLTLNSKIINNIGAARRVLMYIAADRLEDDNGWVATTDADTITNSNWVHKIINQPHNYDMICGKINVNTTGLNDDVIGLLKAKASYNLLKTQLESIIVPDDRDPWPKHNHHSGPSLALRKKVYVAIDGIPPVPFLEDIQLYHRVKVGGYAIRHLNDWEVETSGRLFSKTAGGLGSELKQWSKHETTYCVEDADALLVRFDIYKKIKMLFSDFNSTVINDIAQSSFLDKLWVMHAYETSLNDHEMILKIDEQLSDNSCWRKTHPIQNIFEVNKHLAQYLESLICASSAT